MSDFAKVFTDPGVSKLAKAAVKDDVAKLNKLLAKGADLGGVGICAWNVLMLALAARKRKAFRALLDAGADTAVRMLLVAGADSNIPDLSGGTALHHAAERARYQQIFGSTRRRRGS